MRLCFVASGAALILLTVPLAYEYLRPKLIQPLPHKTQKLIHSAIFWSIEAKPTDCKKRRRLAELEFIANDPRGSWTFDDSWGHPLWMHCHDGKFEVRSAGEDGLLDTEDDITAYTFPWDPAREALREREEAKQWQ